MDYLSVCITGIDGTGKSTIVELVKKLFPKKKCVVQYMGLKQWETKCARICCNSNNFIIRKLQPFAIMYELRYRVLKYANKNIVVVFDRYTFEQYLEYKTRPKNIKNTIILKLYERFLYKKIYRPTITFYLTCDIKVSLDRKNDILPGDIKHLKKIKGALDNFYKSDNMTITIDTGKASINDTLNYIKDKLGELKCFNTLMN